MEQKPKKKYVQKQAPDKPKYKENSTKNSKKSYQNQEPKHESKGYLPKSSNQQRQHKPNRANNRPKRQNDFKPPKFIERVSSHTDDFSCVICSQSVRKKDPIWTCSCCYLSIHLKCIKAWILNVNKDKNKNQILYDWTCPLCKEEYKEIMPKYYCYCGKYQNPEYERDIEAHSCGQICDRKRGVYCTHPCPQRCHKGKCSPCEHEGIKISCECGKSQRMVKCSEDRQIFQCGKKCEKSLNCLKHKCEKNCHHGQCQPCKKKHLVDCHCKKNQDVVDCLETSYSCEQACGKLLGCSFHKCCERCHEGECKQCKLTPELQKTCPCGKYSIQMLTGDENFRKECSDPIPICGMPCKKKLECGHECSKSCHEGPCSDCKVIVNQNCACALTNRKLECFRVSQNKQTFKCENICKRKRNCGQHNCNTECCEFRSSAIAQEHSCQLTCPKMLNCGKHNCGQNCHMGLCKKCPVIYSQPQPCPCGNTFLRPPIICGTVVPQCQNKCDKEMQCGHKCSKPCHYGACQCYEQVSFKCRCGKEDIPTVCGRETLCLNKCQKLMDCGHKCLIQCHNGTCQQAHEKIPCRKRCQAMRLDCGHNCSQLCHPERTCESFPCQAQIYIKCECGHRQTSILCGMTGKKNKKQIKCNKKCQNLKRFDKLYKGKEIYYPNSMVHFALKNLAYLQNLQARLNKFILQSQNPIFQVQYRFSQNYSKIILLNLFENHYHLHSHFYRIKKFASFTLTQTESTMIPRPSLSEYATKVSKGQINPKNIPFQYTISFETEQKDKSDIVLRSLKPFMHKYYMERKQKHVYAHFWSKEEGYKAKNILEADNPSYEFFGEEYQNQDIQIIEANEIVETELTLEQIERQKLQFEKINKIRKISQNDQTEQKTGEVSAKIEQGIQTSNLPILKTIPLPPNLTEQQRNKKRQGAPTIIIKKSNIIFQAREYPDSKQHIQDIYQIDEDELYGEKIDWDKLILNLSKINMGPQASEWRLRAYWMISGFVPIDQVILKQAIEKILKMYEKDKAKAKRILELQKLDPRSVKQEMMKDGIYLSDHQPEILAYAMLYNYLAIDKIEVNLDQNQLKTQELTQAIEILQCVDNNNFEEFYQIFSSSHYVLACTLVQFVHTLRENTIDLFEKHEKIPKDGLFKFLLFNSQAELITYWKSCGLNVDTKFSKVKKEDVYYIQEGEQSTEKVRNERFVEEKVKPKRDKKFFLQEPEELVDGQWMTRSFFAFGDFKESVNGKYMQSLIKSLKVNENSQ